MNTIDTEAGVKSKFYGNEFEINYKDNLESEIVCNKLLLLGFRSSEYHVLEDIANMVEFDIMHFSPLANLAFATIDQRFLASAVNRKCKSI